MQYHKMVIVENLTQYMYICTCNYNVKTKCNPYITLISDAYNVQTGSTTDSKIGMCPSPSSTHYLDVRAMTRLARNQEYVYVCVRRHFYS